MNPMLDVWLQRLVPIITGFAGATLGALVSFRTHKLNTKREEKIRKENEVKERELLIRGMFGRLFALHTIILNTLQLEVQHAIQVELFSRYFELETDKDLKQNFYDRNTLEYSNKMDKSVKLREYLREFSDVVGQFFFLYPQSCILQLYSDFFEKSKQMHIKLELSALTNKNEMKQQASAEIKRLNEFCENEIGKSIGLVLECIRTTHITNGTILS